VLVSTGGTAAPGPTGGRPAAVYRFADRGIRVTDPFAVLRPPGNDQAPQEEPLPGREAPGAGSP
jgi:8-oxo-dGTP diphosphatase